MDRGRDTAQFRTAPATVRQPDVPQARTPRTVPDLAARRARPDILGALLLTVAISCAVLLLSWGGGQYDWGSRVVLGLACGAVGTGLLYLVVACWAPEPIVPLRLLRDPVLLASGIAAAALGVALFGTATHLPALLRQTAAPDAGALRTGLLLLPFLGALALAGLLTGHVISRTGRHTVPAVTGTAVAVVGMWLLTHLRADTPRVEHSVWQAVLGTGLGAALPALTAAVQNAAPHADLGAATGTHTLFRQLGGCAGATLLGTLVGGGGSGPLAFAAGHTQAYAEAAPRALLHLVPVLGLGLLFAFFLKENREERPVAEPHLAAGPVPPARTPASVSLPALTPADPRPRPPGAPLRGTVRHHDGSGVPGAALTLVDVDGRQTGRATSGPDGRYALGTPAPGSYVLIASAGGHQPQALTVTVGEPPEGPAERDILLGGAGRLTGTVATADGTPVEGAAVTLTDGRGEMVATARTGADGGYVLADLVAGTYTLAAVSSGLRPAARPVSVHPDRETRRDLALAGGALVHGTVRAPGGRPVEEARVTLLDAGGNVVGTLTTGSDGIFRFADLTAGSYTVIASGYPPSAAPLQVAGDGRAERDVHLGHRD
ncbi:MFS transporter [Streptomyces sp. MUM 203J]|nr:MFS transporter [Streptomyces sp. MUM 203J]